VRAYLVSLVLLAVLIAGCRSASRPNQKQHAVSPSGKYVLTVPIRKNPQIHDSPAWQVTISDVQGKILYQDEGSTMLAYFNVYWGWDAHDRVWLFNSDDGTIWRFEQDPGGWRKGKSTKNDGMPAWILPKYAK
jgi:hypothetical protein